MSTEPRQQPDEDDAYAPQPRATLNRWQIAGLAISLLGVSIICVGGLLRWGSLALVRLGVLGPEWEYTTDLLPFTAYPGMTINFLGVVIIAKSWIRKRATSIKPPGSE